MMYLLLMQQTWGEIYVIIYDRWGLKMFESISIGNVRWDGKTKAVQL